MGCGPDGYLVYLPAPDEPEEDRASVSHTIAPIPLEPGEERFRCHAWTLDNERPVYVNAVHFLNAGSIHHSNWYVVPDTVYDGPDGTFDCGERDFDGLAAAQAGTVLFAQSTQAWEESLAFGDGTVIRIPERSRIVGELHVLNLAPAARDTDARITLELLHPYHVETVLNPMLLSYLPIEVPGGTEVVHRTTCFVGEDLVIHHVLPHFHGTTNLFDLRMDDSADSLLRIEGFGASPLGKAFDPPLEVPESSKLTMSCRIRNPYAETIEWGIGIDEMCLAFAMVDSRSLNVGVATQPDELRIVDDVLSRSAKCDWVRGTPGAAGQLPYHEERGEPLYIPPNVDEVEDIPAPECVDADSSVAPTVEATLANVEAHVLEPWCSFSACHGVAEAAGLFLGAANLHGQLMGHEVISDTDLPLVEPGDAEGSWLYRMVSRCEPGGGAVHMPRNAPVLLDDETVAIVRAWIDAGAPDWDRGPGE